MTASLTDDHMSKLGIEPAVRQAKYKVVRHYMNGTKRTVRTGLYLFEAQAHCKDPETSSRTCTKKANRQRTTSHGHWFEGYELMRGKRR